MAVERAQEQDKATSRRELVARWTPAMLAATLSLLLFFDGPLGSRALYSVFFGIVFEVGAALLLLAAWFVVQRIAGTEEDPGSLYDRRTTGALVAITVVYFLGVHWKTEQERLLRKCVHEHVTRPAWYERTTPEELIDTCLREQAETGSNIESE